MAPTEKTEPKKRGKPCDFQGARLALLVSFLPKYASLSKARKASELWGLVFPAYWAAFPWRLPLTQEPDEDDPMDYGRDPEDDEEKEKKAEVLAEIEKVGELLVVVWV